jgi:predicted nucleic acid-binding protein
MILDTSILIDLQRKQVATSRKVEEFAQRRGSPPCVAFVTYFEFYYGLQGSKRKEEAMSLVSQLTFLPPTKKTAEILAEMKHTLESKGTVISLADLMIASQAKEHHLPLVTKDAAFLRIKEIETILIA